MHGYMNARMDQRKQMPCLPARVGPEHKHTLRAIVGADDDLSSRPRAGQQWRQ